MPKITINGQVYEAAKGKTIIQAADDVGMEIPRYCYHPDIGIEGSCRMCLVEVKGTPKLLPACATPLADNMEVRTDTQRVHEAVRYAMEFLLLHHPIDCPVCDQSGECWLQDYYMAHAGHDSRYLLGQKTRRRKAFNLGPLVKLDQERCIMSYGINPDAPNAWDYRFCGKCVLRLRGWNVLALTDRYTP